MPAEQPPHRGRQVGQRERLAYLGGIASGWPAAAWLP